jgi:hypothetical protein
VSEKLRKLNEETRITTRMQEVIGQEGGKNKY